MSAATMNLASANGLRNTLGGLVLLGLALQFGVLRLPASVDFTATSSRAVAAPSLQTKAPMPGDGPQSISLSDAVRRAGPVPGVEPAASVANNARPMQARVPEQKSGPVELAAAREQILALADPRSLERNPEVFAFLKRIEPVPASADKSNTGPGSAIFVQLANR
jgi:hypothetical protein